MKKPLSSSMHQLVAGKKHKLERDSPNLCKHVKDQDRANATCSLHNLSFDSCKQRHVFFVFHAW